MPVIITKRRTSAELSIEQYKSNMRAAALTFRCFTAPEPAHYPPMFALRTSIAATSLKTAINYRNMLHSMQAQQRISHVS